MAIWSRLTALVAGIGISRAAGVVLEPALEPQRQKAWRASKSAILSPGELAMLVAQGLADVDQAADEALANGYMRDKFDALVQAALQAAPIAQTLELWRRGTIGVGLVDHALAKAQIEPQYWPAIKDLYTTRVPADLLAFAHQRGIVDNPADPVTGELLIPVSPPTTDVRDVNGNPSPIQQARVALDVLAEFRATGWDFPRAAVNARARGLPPAPGELLQLLNRKTISMGEYYVGIGEGDVRNEWRDYLATLRRRLLTPHDYAELQLRGFLTAAERDTGAELSGMEPADAQLLYDLLGRSIPVHQITTGLARGGTYQGPIDQIPAEYLASLERGNLRPEYYNLAYANRFTIPSYFVIEKLLAAQKITPAYGQQLFTDLGWPPELAALAAGVTTGTTAAAGKRLTPAQLAVDYEAGQVDRAGFIASLEQLGYDQATADAYATTVDNKHVAAARNRILTRLHDLFVKGTLDATQLASELAATQLPQATQAALLAAWEDEARIDAL